MANYIGKIMNSFTKATAVAFFFFISYFQSIVAESKPKTIFRPIIRI